MCATASSKRCSSARELAEHRVAADVQPRVVDAAQPVLRPGRAPRRRARRRRPRSRRGRRTARSRPGPTVDRARVERRAAVGQLQRRAPSRRDGRRRRRGSRRARLERRRSLDASSIAARGAARLEVARRGLDPAGEQQRVARSRGRRRVAGGVERGQEALRAAAVAEHDPRPAEPVGDRAARARVVRVAPRQRGVDVRPLGAREAEVLGLAARCARRRSTSAAAAANHAACAANRAVGQPPRPSPRARTRGCCRAAGSGPPSPSTITSERLGEPADDVDRRRRGHVERLEHRLDGGERRAAGERRERPQAALVVGEQQVVAPADRRLQRAAALGPAARRVAQHAEAVVEPAGDLLDRQRLRARGGQLDRQRQTVERRGTARTSRSSPGRRGTAA